MNELSLRRVKENDWIVLTRIRNESAIRHASLNTKKFNLLEYQKYIKSQLAQCKKNKHWVVQYNGKIIGHAKIINQELGYLITKSHRDKGLGSEVIRKLFNEAKKLGYSQVYVLIKINQPKALWFAIKNDFKMIGLNTKNSKPYAYKLLRELE